DQPLDLEVAGGFDAAGFEPGVRGGGDVAESHVPQLARTRPDFRAQSAHSLVRHATSDDMQGESFDRSCEATSKAYQRRFVDAPDVFRPRIRDAEPLLEGGI